MTAHNKATNIVIPKFSIGDCFLVRRAQDLRHKLQFRWFGPCLIKAVHRNLVDSVAPLGGKNRRNVVALVFLLIATR